MLIYLIQPSDNSNLSSFIYDAKRFVLTNRWIIEHAPLQIYASALMCSPRECLVRSRFQHLVPSQSQGPNSPWVALESTLEEDWSPILSTFVSSIGGVHCLTFSPTTTLLAGGLVDNTVMLWDYSTGTERMKFDSLYIAPISIAFSPSGRFIAVGGWSSIYPPLVIVELATGDTIYFTGEDADDHMSIQEVFFSQTSDNVVVTVSDDGIVQNWNVNERKELCKWTASGLTKPFSSTAAFSPDGSYVVIGSKEGLVKCWDVETGDLLKTFQLRDGEQLAYIAISLDGKMIAFASWSLPTDDEDSTSSNDENSASESDASTTTDDDNSTPTSNKSVDSSDYRDFTVRLYRFTTILQQFEVRYRSQTPGPIAFVPLDGGMLAIGLKDGGIELRNVDTWAIKGGYDASHTPDVIAISPDGKLMATGAVENGVRILDMSLAETESSKTVLDTSGFAQFIPGDNDVVLTSFDDNTKLWNVADGSSQDFR